MDSRAALVGLFASLVPLACGLSPPPLGTRVYTQKGDISLGALFAISEYSERFPCGRRLRSTQAMQYVEAFVFAIEAVNARQDLLRGVRLGFTVLDTCAKPQTALAQLLHLRLPRWVSDTGSGDSGSGDSTAASSSNGAYDGATNASNNGYIYGNGTTTTTNNGYNGSTTASNNGYNGTTTVSYDGYSGTTTSNNNGYSGTTTANNIENWAADTYAEDDDDDDGVCLAPGEKEQGTVVGIVGALRSTSSMAVASLSAYYELPQISYASTSDLLSDRRRYPYFLRLVPPDRFQIEAVVALIRFYGWSYVAFLHDDGDYGYGGYELFRRHIDRRLCVAVGRAIPEDATAAEFDAVAAALAGGGEALRVIVLFTGPLVIRPLLAALHRAAVADDRFVWIGGDAVGNVIVRSGSDRFVRGFFSFHVPSSLDGAAFDARYRALNPINNARNPWFADFWRMHFNCSFDSASGDHRSSRCDPRAVLGAKNGYRSLPEVGVVTSIVSMFALALDRLITARCPNVTGRAVLACLDGPALLATLKTTVLHRGDADEIRFNTDGEVNGRYLIRQVQADGAGGLVAVSVAEWRADTGRIHASTEHRVMWYGPGGGDAGESRAPPVSVCSEPCSAHQALVPSDLTCCWICLECRPNEFVPNNATSCTACPRLTWPVRTTFDGCRPIAPTYLRLTRPLGVTLATLSLVGLLVACAVGVYYVQHVHEALIKASGRELSYTMLAGIIAGYATAFLLLVYPERSACAAANFLFPISFASIYSALLVRTIVIYRVFKSANTSKAMPTCVNRRGQMLTTSSLVLVQVGRTRC